jgi:hypothetical protein
MQFNNNFFYDGGVDVNLQSPFGTTVGSNLKPTCYFKSYSLREAENLKESGRFYLGDNYIN